MDGSEAIWTDHLSYRFARQRRWAVQDICLTVGWGEWVVLVGPNEAGKSTLIRLLATLLTPTRGRALVGGYDVVRHGARVRRLVGVVLDRDHAFYYRLTAAQNLEFFGGLYGLYGRRLRARVDDVLALVGLTHARNVRFAAFSAGMRKRLALARAFLADPPIYLLDEPFAHLDAGHPRALADVLARLRDEGRTLLTTAPAADGLLARADRVIHLAQGRIAAP